MSPHILALDIAGAPHRWITVRQAAHYYATDMILLDDLRPRGRVHTLLRKSICRSLV